MKKLQEVKSRLEFWWARKTIKDGRDFDLQMDELGMLVTILTGEFKGTQFRYSPLSVREDNEGLVDFATYVEYAPHSADVANPKFTKLTTNILRILLTDAIPETAAQAHNEVQVTNENRDIDTGESFEERGFYEESTPVLEKRVSKRKPRKKAVRPDNELHSEVQQPAKPKRARARTARAKRPK